MRYRHLWRLLLPALLVVGLFAGAPRAQAQDARLVWSRVSGVEPSITLQSVFMADSAHALAIGNDAAGTSGYIYRITWQDGRWHVTRAGGVAHALYALVALDQNTGWVVGANGYIAKYSDMGWQQYDSPVPDAELHAIQMLGDGSEGWALGSRFDSAQGLNQPVALRYSRGRWAKASIEGGGSVASVHLNEGGGWAVGSNIWRLRDGAWRLEQSPTLCDGFGCVGSLSAVRAIDGERAIAVGSWSGSCGICTSHLYVATRDRDGWKATFADSTANDTLPEPTSYPDTSYLGGFSLTDARNGLAVGNRNYPHADGSYGPDSAMIFGLRYSDGAWSYEPILSSAGQSVTSLSMHDTTHMLLVGSGGLILSYGYGPQVAADNPTAPIPAPNQPDVLYFSETGHSLRGAFRAYWERYGGLAQFGYPLTEGYPEMSETDGKTYTVQYFERARFEYHPENAGTRYEVLLGLLGRSVTAGRADQAAFQSAAPTGQTGSRYFTETNHSMAAEFVGYWDAHGGLAIYGYPISDPFTEVNAADGQRYLVQYFERNRFEYHPEKAGTPYEVLLGLLGSETLRVKGWIQ